MCTAITVVLLLMNVASAVVQASYGGSPWLTIINAFVAGGLAAVMIEEAMLWRLRRRIRGEWR